MEILWRYIIFHLFVANCLEKIECFKENVRNLLTQDDYESQLFNINNIDSPYILSAAIKDIILGIPTSRITIAYDESIEKYLTRSCSQGLFLEHAQIQPCIQPSLASYPILWMGCKAIEPLNLTLKYNGNPGDLKLLKHMIVLIQRSGISVRIYQLSRYEQEKFFSYVKKAHEFYEESSNIILSNPEVAEIMLYKILEYDLINRNILYIFQWKKLPVSHTFQNLLLEAMRVALIINHRLGTYRIYYNQAKPDGSNKLSLVNWWSYSEGLFRFPVLPPATIVFNNFERRLISVPVLHKPPWNFVDYENGTFLTDGGRDDKLLKLLASKLNFRFEYVDPPERILGSGIGDNGTYRGVLGLIWRREAPFVLGDVTITYERIKIVDFSSPTLADCGTFVTHSPRQLNEALALVRPFHWQAWLPVAATALLSGPVLFLVIEAPSFWRRRKHKNKTNNLLQKCIWFSVGIFLKQSVKEPSKKHKVRLLTILLSIIATYVIGGLYSATLISLLARPAREQPIRTLEELEHAMRVKGYQLLVERHSSSLSILQNGTGVYGRLWKLMRGDDLLVDSVEEGMKYIQEISSTKALLAGRETLFFDSRRFGAHHFYLADCLFTRYSAIAMQSGSPYRDNFDRLIIRLSEAGILTKMMKDEYERLGDKVDKVNKSVSQDVEEDPKENDKLLEDEHNTYAYQNEEAIQLKKHTKRTQESSGGNDGERKVLKPVSVKMLQGAFFVLLIGCAIAGLVFYSEVFIAYHKDYHKKRSKVRCHHQILTLHAYRE